MGMAALTALSTASSAQAQPAPELSLPVIKAPEPRVIEEQGESPVHYRRSPRIVLPTMRLGVGYHGRLPIGEFDGASGFTFDAYLGAAVRFGRGARTGLLAQLGYSYVTFPEHLASAGLGVLYGIGAPEPERPDDTFRHAGFRFAVVPHAVAGYAYGGGVVGARTSVIIGYWFYALEVSHQLLRAAPGQTHEVHLMFTSVTPFGEDE